MYMGKACVLKEDPVDGGFDITRVCKNVIDIMGPIDDVLSECS